jgi:hypothetical protein
MFRVRETWRRGGEHCSTPSATFARSWGLNPFVVLAIRLMSRRATAAARSHHARFEYIFVRADGEQLGRITRLVESGAIKPLLFGQLAQGEGGQAEQ